MKLKKLILPILFLVTTTQIVTAQEKEVEEEKEEFKPSGKIIGTVFFDYSTGLGNEEEETGFDVTRAFLGYNYKFTPNFQAQIVVDGAAGKNDKGNLEPAIRNAFIRYEEGNLTIDAGLIGLHQFTLQQKFWKHRYAEQTFQGLNKMANGADGGIFIAYKFSPLFSADLTYANGEGYKKLQKNASNRYSLGLTLNPTPNITFRAYGDIYNESEKMRATLPLGVTEADYKNQYMLSLFGGYQNEVISVGAEYARQFNKGFIEGKDCFGYSLFATLQFAPKWSVYGRYDQTDSSSPSNFTAPWHTLDGQYMMVGVEYQLLKQIRFSPNIRNFNPDGRESEQYIFLSAEFNL